MSFDENAPRTVRDMIEPAIKKAGEHARSRRPCVYVVSRNSRDAPHALFAAEVGCTGSFKERIDGRRFLSAFFHVL